LACLFTRRFKVLPKTGKKWYRHAEDVGRGNGNRHQFLGAEHEIPFFKEYLARPLVTPPPDNSVGPMQDWARKWEPRVPARMNNASSLLHPAYSCSAIIISGYL
jgi:hypothetical protein